MKQENFQSENHYEFVIQKLENLPLFVQEVVMPGIFTEAPQTGTQFSPIKHIGDSLFFQDLYLTIKLDEGMETWFEMFKWLTGLTRSESYGQFQELIKDGSLTLDGSKKLFKSKQLDATGKGYKNTKSIATLTVNDANHISYMNILFMNLHPTAMSGFNFQTDNTGIQYITYDVTFTYDFFFPTLVRS